MKAGDVALLTLGVETLAYELLGQDLLTHAVHRHNRKHPVLSRLVVAAIAGHLLGWLPVGIDVLSGDNRLHRWAYRVLRIDAIPHFIPGEC